MGAANPIERAKKIIEIAQKQGIQIKVAAVSGDDVIDELRRMILKYLTTRVLHII